ncbi:unnamed protein product [Leptosia nina]|uniref:Uncharacterized protein n=1 Tax=Leptosia nina TaxID=320188 RepID=A0AAV1JJ49_9NEOP
MQPVRASADSTFKLEFNSISPKSTLFGSRVQRHAVTPVRLCARAATSVRRLTHTSIPLVALMLGKFVT